jgi:hypothetical protein
MQHMLFNQQMTLAKDAADHQTQLANNRAKLEMGNSFVQWQLKQLSELYGPLHALLRQSNALYRHMNSVLAKVAPEHFRLDEVPQGIGFDNIRLMIQIGGQWGPFRTIMHINEVYGKGYRIEAYFDEIVAIGARIVKVIEEKAGYARPEQKELSSVFGKYLAHYSVLHQLHASMKKAVLEGRDMHGHEAAPAIIVDQSAVFPMEIQLLVNDGFDAINDEITRWRSQA